MDQESLQFHIQENDYFGTLATVLDLLGQDLRRRGHIRHADMLHRLRNDLTYLQHRYRIEEIPLTRSSRAMRALFRSA